MNTTPRAEPGRITLRLDEVARALGIGRRTLERAIHAGEFPAPSRRVGRVPLWSADVIRQWLESDPESATTRGKGVAR